MKKILVALVILDLALVAFSLRRFPQAGLVNAAPVVAALVIYGLAVWQAWEKTGPQARLWGLRLGSAAGLILGGEALLEYALQPVDNSAYGLVEYGLFLLILIACGALAYREDRRLQSSVQAGLWAGMIGSLIWYGVVLLALHVFFGTAQQAQVWRAEGELEDFTRSGLVDLTTFVVQDLFGAGFFHLLLGAAVGAILGTVGGIVLRILPNSRKIKTGQGDPTAS
jgi:hypothetical protein